MFRIGITDDNVYDMMGRIPEVTERLALQPNVESTPVDGKSPITAERLDGVDALIAGGVEFEKGCFADGVRCAAVIRFGSGYDKVDVEACTASGMMVINTPQGVRRPMAQSVMGFLLALSLRIFENQALLRANRWDRAYDFDTWGYGLTGKTMGFVGYGRIGREFHDLIAPFGMKHLVYDPYLSEDDATSAGIALVSLDDLLRASDFVAIFCNLTEQTHHLLHGGNLRLMKPTAYLINAARGPIVDQEALTELLVERRIKGAALDVFEHEPLAPGHPLRSLDNVILTPHNIGTTDEMVSITGHACIDAALTVMQGGHPDTLINPEVLSKPRLVEKLERYRRAYGG